MFSLAVATVVCGLAAGAEALCMGREGPAFLKRLHQPPRSPGMWVWSLIGVAYYAACFVGLYRLLRFRPPYWQFAFGLFGAVLASNAAWNYVFFRLRDLRLSFCFLIPYGLVVAVLIGTLFLLDLISAVALAAYGAYLPYAAWFSYRTWKLNPAG